MSLMAHFSWLMLFLFVASSNSLSKQEQTDYYKGEDNLIATMEEIRSEIVRLFRTTMKGIRSEITGLQHNLIEVKTLVNTIYLETNALRSNQNSLDSKLENVISRIKEIEEISNDTRNEIGFCRENLTDLVLKKISSQIEYEKEILSNEENLTDLVFKNISSQSENEKNILSNEGKENTCTDFSKTYLSTINALFHTNLSQYQDAVSNINKCWKDLPKTMEGHTYFLTPNLKWDEAVSYCYNHGGRPFIPKTQDEFIAYVALTVKSGILYAWYPVNDINEEGHVVLYDGTDYEKASYRFQKWERRYPTFVDMERPNTVNRDCVLINIFGEASWTWCNVYEYVLLCRGK